jgi:hypothetical protein
VKLKLLAILILVFSLTGCPKREYRLTQPTPSPTATPDPFECKSINYGSGVYYVTGKDFGVCLARLRSDYSKKTPCCVLLIDAVAPVLVNNQVLGYYVITNQNQ